MEEMHLMLEIFTLVLLIFLCMLLCFLCGYAKQFVEFYKNSRNSTDKVEDNIHIG